MSAPDFGALEQQYGLPPGILGATMLVESGGNPRAVSPAGARGAFQFMPATARSLGVSDPHDIGQAAPAAARLWAENLKATGGDIDAAAKMYNAGTDRRRWNNPETAAYPGKLASKLQELGIGGAPAPAASGGAPAPAGGGGSDPFAAAFDGDAGGSAQGQGGGAPSDPFEAALSGQQQVPDPKAIDDQLKQMTLEQRQAFFKTLPPEAVQGYAQWAQKNLPDTGGDYDVVNMGGVNFKVPKAKVAEPAPRWMLETGLDNIANGFTAGLLKPVAAAGDALLPSSLASYLDTPGMKSVWDGASFGDAYSNNLARLRAQQASNEKANPVSAVGGDITGAVLSPINKLAAPVEGLNAAQNFGRLLKAGAAYGGVRGLADTGSLEGGVKGAALGFGLAPAGAVAGHVLGAAGGRVAQKVAPKLAAALASFGGDAGAVAGKALAPAAEDAITVTAPKVAPKELAAALGSNSSRRGIESTTSLPPQVSQRVDELVAKGVPTAQALNEADLAYVGARPTMANATRSRADWTAQQDAIGLKTPEAQQLAAQHADNNAAVIGTVRQTIDGYGGVPAAGEGAETAAQSLARASDAERANVNQLYAAARAQDGDIRVDVPELRAVLSDPANRAAVTNEGSAFVGGMSKRAGILNPDVPNAPQGLLDRVKQLFGRDLGSTPKGMTADELEQLRQAANNAYDPTGQRGEVNALVGQVKQAIDTAQDRLGGASQAYGQARAAYKNWATKYDDPEGVSQLIRRDAQGSFVNADNWRKAEGMVGTLADKPFVQVVGQLKANGDTAALGRLKATVLQNAYERATKAAGDELGNARFSASLFRDELNKVGATKLNALFEPDELAHVATVYRAARALNDPVPNTGNPSGTASKLYRLLNEPKSDPSGVGKFAAKALAHGVAAVTHPGVGNLAVLGSEGAIGRFSSARQSKALAEAMRQFGDPEMARAAAQAEAKAQVAKANRAQLAEMLARRGAVAAATNAP